MNHRVEELFHQVADLSPEDRMRYFTEREVDLTTQREVEALLVVGSHASTTTEPDAAAWALFIWRSESTAK